MIRLIVGLVLIGLPVIELATLIKTGQIIGVWPTVALVIGMGLAGLLILSRQSLTVFRQTLESVSEGRAPVGPVLDGLFLVVAGVLLITPGLITDVLGLLLLVPPLRRWLATWSVRRVLNSPHVRVTIQESGRGPPPGGPGRGDGQVIDGEFRRVEDPAQRLRPPREG